MLSTLDLLSVAMQILRSPLHSLFTTEIGTLENREILLLNITAMRKNDRHKDASNYQFRFHDYHPSQLEAKVLRPSVRFRTSMDI